MEYKEKMEFIEDFLIEPNSHSSKVIEMVTEYKNFLEEAHKNSQCGAHRYQCLVNKRSCDTCKYSDYHDYLDHFYCKIHVSSFDQPAHENCPKYERWISFREIQMGEEK